MKYKVLITLLCINSLCYGQIKNEKEFRILLPEFPKPAQNILVFIPEKAKRIRYYKETDVEKESFEAKFKYQKHWYSVEFDANGNLEDVEVLIKEKQIKKTIKNTIITYLKTNSDKFKIIKIQEQYVYSKTTNNIQFLNSIFKNRIQIPSRFELIVAIKTNKVWQLKEITFNQNGTFVNARNLQQDSYEYILY